MKLRVVLLLLFSFFSIASFAQKPFPDKIKVILLGTFHYGITTDSHKTPFNDLFSPARQQQLDAIAAAMGKQHVTKIFVEAEPDRQAFHDSLYNVYLKHGKIDSMRFRNEIVQLGFRTAAKLKLPGVKCADYQQPLPYDAMEAFEKAHKDLQSPPFFDTPWPFTDASQKADLATMTLSDYYKNINNLYHRKATMYDYLHYSMAYTVGNDYTGVNMATSFYDRNLKIYTNILRELKPDDTCILVIFGSSHTAFLRQFFEMHPKFEIVELDAVL